MRFFVVLTFLIISHLSSALTVKEVLQKMKDNYKKSTGLEYTTTYQLFKGHKSNEVHSSYTGYMYRKGKELYQKINKTEFIYGKDFFLKINHAEKIVLLDVVQQNINLEVDDATVLDQCKETKLEDKGSYYSVTLIYKAISASPFTVVKLRVSKSDYELQQLDLYYARIQDFATKYTEVDNAQPHLKIVYNNVNKNPKDRSDLFLLSKYISTSKNINKPTNKYSGYELIDNRVK